MTIRTVHQVINKSGTVIGEFMDIKLAKDLDNRTDVLYFIADLIESAGIDETTAEKVADVMLEDNTRKQLLNQLKSVKTYRLLAQRLKTSATSTTTIYKLGFIVNPCGFMGHFFFRHKNKSSLIHS